jgi:hypothetical protein
MDPFLVSVIIVLGTLLLAVTMFMEWVGVMSLFTPRSGPRYDGCGHLRLIRTATADRCWGCRHARLEHVLHVPGHEGHQSH